MTSDERVRRRSTTVDLLEEEAGWDKRGGWPNPDELVEVRIGYAEIGLRQKIKGAGG